MSQPPSFTCLDFHNHVCRLKRGLYGLRQAPRAPVSRLIDKLQGLDFVGPKADTSLYILHTNHVRST